MNQHSHNHPHGHDHAHGHRHAHQGVRLSTSAERSLLRASAVGRLGVAAVAIATVWAGVFWAMS